MEIDKRKLKVNTFTTELDKPLDRNLRAYITIEADIYEVATQDNQDGTFDEVYKSKLVGSTIIKQGNQKDYITGKSKRSQSQKVRASIWKINPDENYYEVITNKMIANMEDLIQWLKDK